MHVNSRVDSSQLKLKSKKAIYYVKNEMSLMASIVKWPFLTFIYIFSSF